MAMLAFKVRLGTAIATCAVMAFAAVRGAAQSEEVKAGAVLFGTSGCTFCHGRAGAGTDRAPSLREVYKRLNDQQIRHQIHDGGQMMPPFGEALTEAEIAHLAAFLTEKDAWNLVQTPAAK